MLCLDCHESWATCQYCGKICCWDCAFGECMNVCEGFYCNNVECNRVNCKPTYGCNTRYVWWRMEYVPNVKTVNHIALCKGCNYYRIAVLIFDLLVSNNIRMLGDFVSMCWEIVQATIRYLRSLPWNNILMLWEALCMFWELVKATIGCLRLLPCFREKVPEKKKKRWKKKTKWQKKKGKHR